MLGIQNLKNQSGRFLIAFLLASLALVLVTCGPADESAQRQIGNMPFAEPQQEDEAENPTPTPEPVVECLILPENLQETKELAENQEWRDGVKVQCFTYEATPTPKYPALGQFSQYAQIAEATKEAQESGDGEESSPSEGTTTEVKSYWVVVKFDGPEDVEAQVQWFKDNRVKGGDNDEKFKIYPCCQIDAVLPATALPAIAEMEGFWSISGGQQEYQEIPPIIVPRGNTSLSAEEIPTHSYGPESGHTRIGESLMNQQPPPVSAPEPAQQIEPGTTEESDSPLAGVVNFDEIVPTEAPANVAPEPSGTEVLPQAQRKDSTETPTPHPRERCLPIPTNPQEELCFILPYEKRQKYKDLPGLSEIVEEAEEIVRKNEEAGGQSEPIAVPTAYVHIRLAVDDASETLEWLADNGIYAIGDPLSEATEMAFANKLIGVYDYYDEDYAEYRGDGAIVWAIVPANLLVTLKDLDNVDYIDNMCRLYHGIKACD